MRKGEIGTLAAEFPAYPADTLPAIPDWMKPQHWHNDSCPSWGFVAANERELLVYVDFLDTAQREVADGGRFSVCEVLPNGDGSAQVVLSTDNWNEALAWLIAARWVARFGLGFHPDTRGASYVTDGTGVRCLTDAEAAEYDGDMDKLWQVAADPYESGLNAMARFGLIPSDGGEG